MWMLIGWICPLYAVTPRLHADGNVLKDPAGNVVVLRGVDLVDLGATQLWYGGAINMINRLTDKTDSQGNSPGWYPRVIRIAIYPSDEDDFTSPWTFVPGSDDFYNNLLRPVVDHCLSKDLYAIIDLHCVANTYDHVSMASAFWEYMAPRFADDSHVIFELFNEPINPGGSDTDRWLSVRSDMQTWIDIVRTYAPDTLILVAGPSYSQIIGPAATYPVSDPIGGQNIAYVSHIYPGHLDGTWGNAQWYINHVETCAAVYPVFMSEWGFSASGGTGLTGSITSYGQPLMDWIEGLKISNTAWVASYDWRPSMFYSNWTLRCGEEEMGCFVKDLLYQKRNDDQPGEGIGNPPTCSIIWPHNQIRIPADTTLTIHAEASDTDGTITKVEFYEGTTKLGEDTESPYTCAWTDVPAGTYTLTAKATDNDARWAVSSAVTLVVGGSAIPQTTRYEAENAAYTETVSLRSSSQASGGQYLRMTDSGTITWTITAPSAGSYALVFGYNLYYGTPKTQYLRVNGGSSVDLVFDDAQTQTWLEKTITVSLNAGSNQIQVEKYWGWMYFDYIQLEVPVLCSEGDLNLDCQVNMDDLMIMAVGWLNPYEMADLADVSRDWNF
jgi:hypothetical protein